MQLTSSVLIASFQRPVALERCLKALASQTVQPAEIVIAWQENDFETKSLAEGFRKKAPFRVLLIHSSEKGIVAAENAALKEASGEIILLIDDDAIPTPHWVEKHLFYYQDPKVGGVGGAYINFQPDGRRFPPRTPRVIGRVQWFGRFIGEMFDHPKVWSERTSVEVDHLVGNNMSIRRSAFLEFNADLRSYWQLFEADACFQVKHRGFKLIFDFNNSVSHFPTNLAYDNRRRDGDLQLKVFNPAYNHALILAKFSPLHLRIPRFLYLVLLGSRVMPGLIGFLLAVRKYGNWRKEMHICGTTIKHYFLGWRVGAQARRTA